MRSGGHFPFLILTRARRRLSIKITAQVIQLAKFQSELVRYRWHYSRTVDHENWPPIRLVAPWLGYFFNTEHLDQFATRTPF